jgi:rRNA-processing protein FCF1
VAERRERFGTAAEEPRGVVLLDTNALLLPFRERFPLDRELARVAPGRVVAVPRIARSELARLAAGGSVAARAALAWSAGLPVRESAGRGDGAVVRLAERLRAWVVTGDRALIDRLRGRGLTVLRPRERARLELLPGRRRPRVGPTVRRRSGNR